jgi:hypothetical protein
MKKNNIIQKIDGFVFEGMQIARDAQENDAIYKVRDSEDFDFSDNVFKRHWDWVERIKRTLNTKEINQKIDIGFLYDAKSVPKIKPGGIEYGNIRSEKSQELLKNIRIETNRVIEWLRGAKNKLLEINQEIENNKQNRFPHKLPSGTDWGNITIKFLDSERVFIKAYKFEHQTDYSSMGFEDKRNHKADSQWELFLILSKNNGVLSWKNSEAEDRFKKIKERLSKTLKHYFSIDYDPFRPYKKVRSYEIKITLIAPPTKNEKKESTKGAGLSDEIKEMFDSLVIDDRKY